MPSPEEVKELFERFAPVVHRRAATLLGNDAAAWDAVHDVMRLIIGAGAGFRKESRPMLFIFRSTTTVCLEHMRKLEAADRKKKKRPPPPPGSWVAVASTAAEQVEAPEVVRTLMRVFSKNEKVLESAVYKYVDDMSASEIAAVTGQPLKIVQRELETIREAAEPATPGAAGGT